MLFTRAVSSDNHIWHTSGPEAIRWASCRIVGYSSDGGTFPQGINDLGTVVGYSNGWAGYGIQTGWERLSNGSHVAISDPNASTSIPPRMRFRVAASMEVQLRVESTIPAR